MRGITLLGLTVTCAVLIGASVNWAPKPKIEPMVESLWLPELDISQVNALTLSRRNQPDIRVERRDGLWVVTSWVDFPAAPGGIVKLLRALTTVRKVEAQSPQPQNRAALGLDEQAIRLTLERQEQTPLTLLLGKQVRQGGQVVSQPDSEVTWLLNENLPLPQSPLAWIDRRLTRIPFEHIRQLSLTYPNGARLRILRESSDATSLKLRQYPSTPKVMDEAKATSLLRLFGQLNIADIAIEADEQQMAKPDLSFELLTFSGGKLAGQIRQRDNQYWLKLKTIEGFDTESVQPRMGWVMRVDALLPRPGATPSP
ncbi:DUF4340 domain-containing protein [Pseudomonas sp. SDM007_2]|uniref:DUF4340 domain-containing protein n=1 Tax=Pseudomonas hygromyciniae TaxID=2812000 RepID=UPI00196830E9|nr:DUF4340 domain-containing protein [Pseudomonas hygromyciniae]MBN0978576.1 DUF4340 domain-containing protein [Pseudomonas hygromyciniae]